LSKNLSTENARYVTIRKGGFVMSKKFFVIWSIIYLLIMVILIFGFGKVKSWLDLFTGFVMGVTFWSLLIIYRDRNRKTRNLR